MWFFVSCCFLPLSSIHDVVTVWQPPEPSEKHKHWLNTQFAGGLWERICSYTQGIVSPRCCIPCCSLLSSSPPWPNWTGHWHLVCLSLKCDSGLLVSSCTVSFHVLLMTHRHFLSWYVSPPPPFAYTCHSQLPLPESLSTVSTNYWYLLTVLYIDVFV